MGNKDVKSLGFIAKHFVDESFDNERFIKMQLRVMHDGKNPNYSHFNLEAMEAAKDTLANIPILANVVVDEDGNMDFGAHDIEIEENQLEDGEYKLIYKEIPIGIVPETNDYEIVEYEGRSYVQCTAYVWKDYSNYAEDILKAKDECKLSMEIMVDDYEALESDKDYFDIKSYKYTGITLLGDKYGTGMKDAQADKFEFSNDENKAMFVKMANELKEALAFNEEPEVVEEPEAVVEEPEVIEPEPEIVVEEPAVEPEVVGEPEPEAGAEEPDVEVEPEPEATMAKHEEYSMKASEFRRALSESIGSDYSEKDGREIYRYYYLMDYDDKYAFVDVYECVYGEDSYEDRDYIARIPYLKDGDNITAVKENIEELYVEWLTITEKNELDESRKNEMSSYEEKIKELETALSEKDAEINELQSFKNQIEEDVKKQEIDEIMAEFEPTLKGEDEYVKIKENPYAYEVTELEKELYFLVGKMKHVSKTKQPKKFNLSRVAVEKENEGKINDAKMYYGTASKYLD